LIEIPYGADIEVAIISYDEELVSLTSLGLPNQIMPAQPSVSKSADPSTLPFYFDQGLYNQNSFTSTPLVTVEEHGIMRGVKVGGVTISPIRYNTVQNVLKIYNNLVFEIRFHNADYALTDQIKSKFYSPAFESAYGTLINYKPSVAKDQISKYPIKYVIVSLTTFQNALQPFVTWKRKKGFTVVEQYYASAPTTTTVKTFLQGLYNAGTTLDPAPTYVLFVGDVAQIPTYTGIADAAHKTDLYYCTYDGGSDYIPDMYYGRFSATNTTQLQPQIDKTLMYEQYTMPNPSYLDTCVMIGGVDGTYASVWANGQINYGTTNYFNTAHGFYCYTHLYPNSGNQDATILMEIGRGVGYANYTAHGSSSGWADPTFSTSNIASMANANQYGLMVGNCCQTNTFNDTECFGEALLRTANKGAVGYIGASDYSYWDEDYYWGVGNRASIVVNPTYDANNLGAYDRSFHDHGEAKTAWAITNGQMIYGGNLAVEASSSSLKDYYWEVYHLMGDPSVMNYFTVPDALTVAYTNPQSVGVTSMVVNTEEDAYVAISHNGVLLDAELAPAGGVVTLNFTAFASPDTADIVVTKQNKIPYIGTVRFVAPSIPLDASISGIIVPEATYACAGISINPQVTLTNMGTTTLTSCTILYHIDGQSNSSYVWTGSLASMASATVTLPAITLTAGNHTFYASSSLPNGSADQNTSNDTYTKDYAVTQLTITADFTATPTSNCTAPVDVTFTNTSANGQTYLWDFGDGSTSTAADPVHTYAALGSYTVVLTTSAGVCGSDVETKTAFITVGADIPVAADVFNCGPTSFTLSATGTGTINWYNAVTGGTLLGTGATYTTPVISSTTNYYVEQVDGQPTQYTGKFEKEADAALHLNNSYYLIFNCYTPVVLKSVKVYAGSAGDRIIELRNSAGTVLQSTTQPLPSGESRVTLNFNLPVQNDLRLACGTSNPNMYRDISGITFPYSINGVVSITGTNATGDRYYYYYDWEIEFPACTSAREIVTASILSAAPIASFNSSNVGLTVNFTNTSSNGTTYFWNFGDGTTSTQSDPTHIYAANGLYNVMLIASNDCGSDTTYFNVDLTTVSIADNGSNGSIMVYPNPSRGSITLDLNGMIADKVELIDVTGRILSTNYLVNDRMTYNLNEFGAGVYYFRVSAGEQIFTCKFTNLY
jgi:PKD repeat protein